MEEKEQENLEASSSVQNLLRRAIVKNNSLETKKAYLKALSFFFGWRKEDPDEFILKVKEGKVDPVQVLQDFVFYLSKAGYSPNSIHLFYILVRKFIKVNVEKKFDWSLVEKPRKRVLEQDRIPSKEELKQILEYATLKDKVAVLLLVSSGVRVGTLVKLKVKDVDLNRYNDIGVVYVRPETTKEGEGYVTFITPEAKRYLTEWLEYRKRKNEQIDEESKIIPLKNATSINVRWIRMLKKSAKDKKAKRFYLYHVHTLRKFFRTSLDLAGVSPDVRERLMGHAGGYLAGSYFRPSEEQLANEYRKAIQHLTIFETTSLEELQKQQLINLARVLIKDESKIAQIEQLLKKKRSEEAIVELRKIVQQNSYEYKAVSVNELIEHLNNGWEIVKEVGGSQVIIRKAKV
jgi:integrase